MFTHFISNRKTLVSFKGPYLPLCFFVSIINDHFRVTLSSLHFFFLVTVHCTLNSKLGKNLGCESQTGSQTFQPISVLCSPPNHYFIREVHNYIPGCCWNLCSRRFLVEYINMEFVQVRKKNWKSFIELQNTFISIYVSMSAVK